MCFSPPRPRLILGRGALIPVLGPAAGHAVESPEVLRQDAQKRFWRGHYVPSGRKFRRSLDRDPGHDGYPDAAFGPARALRRFDRFHRQYPDDGPSHRARRIRLRVAADPGGGADGGS